MKFNGLNLVSIHTLTHTNTDFSINSDSKLFQVVSLAGTIGALFKKHRIHHVDEETSDCCWCLRRLCLSFGKIKFEGISLSGWRSHNVHFDTTGQNWKPADTFSAESSVATTATYRSGELLLLMLSRKFIEFLSRNILVKYCCSYKNLVKRHDWQRLCGRCHGPGSQNGGRCCGHCRLISLREWKCVAHVCSIWTTLSQDDHQRKPAE